MTSSLVILAEGVLERGDYLHFVNLGGAERFLITSINDDLAQLEGEHVRVVLEVITRALATEPIRERGE